jgi:hypothetical protein
MFKTIGNNGSLFAGLDKNLINPDNSHDSANFTSTQIPYSNRVLPEPMTKVQAAASYIPGCQKGGKINRKKINKISRKYKMKSRRHIKRIKSMVRSRFSKRHGKNSKRNKKGTRKMKGGWAQYENNMPVDNIYSLGGKLSPSLVGMASPTPISSIRNDAIDNLDHNALNSSGHSGAGNGFASKGWY